MEFPTVIQIYDDYKNVGANYEYIPIAFGNKPDLTAFVNSHPEWHATAWAMDPYWISYTPFRAPWELGAYVPCHFIIDLDGNVRYGQIGGIGTDASILTNIIDELV